MAYKIITSCKVPEDLIWATEPLTSLWSTVLHLKEEEEIIVPGITNFLKGIYFKLTISRFSSNDNTIENVTEEKILWIVIDNKLNLMPHLKIRLTCVNQALSALARISKLTTLHHREKVIYSYINYQFSDCPLIWMIVPNHFVVNVAICKNCRIL